MLFFLPKNIPNPLKISDCPGDFKIVYPNISNFYALAPKTYSVVYEENNVLKSVTKVKGFNLTTIFNDNIINADLFETFLDKAINQSMRKVLVPQFRQKGNSVVETKFQFSNHISERRIPRYNYFTYPYGFFSII